MNYNVDKLLELAGNKGKYQYFILTIGFCLWLTFDLISISLPYLEKTRTLKEIIKTKLQIKVDIAGLQNIIQNAINLRLD